MMNSYALSDYTNIINKEVLSMKEKKLIFTGGLALIMAISLSACMSPLDAIHQKILGDSGIQENKDYRTVQMLQQSGQLNNDGIYKSPESAPQETAEDIGSVQVSFGRNSYLDVFYFQDSELTSAITKDVVYLNPGDSVYVGEPKSKNPNSNLYRLSEYRILEYSMDGKLIKKSTQKPGEDHLLFSVPENGQGHSFSVMPVGIYPDRKVTMTVYYTDDDGEEHMLESAGDWMINQEPCDKNTVNISSVDSFFLRFEFDQQNYFYVDSNPGCFTKDPNQSGFVEFFEEDPTANQTGNYRIELHEYLTLNIKPSKDAIVSVNDKEEIFVKKNKTLSLDDIQYGDRVIVETAGKCEISGDDRHVEAHKDPIGEKYRYTFEVSEQHHKNNKEDLPDDVTVNRMFNVTLDGSCEHAECYYELDGEKVTGTISVREGQELVLYARIKDKGFLFADKKDLSVFYSKTKNERMIQIVPELHNTTIVAEDYFDIIAKEAD